MRIYFEPRDLWVGVYVGPDAVYVCPLPTLVVKFNRRVKHIGLGIASAVARRIRPDPLEALLVHRRADGTLVDAEGHVIPPMDDECPHNCYVCMVHCDCVDDEGQRAAPPRVELSNCCNPTGETCCM